MRPKRLKRAPAFLWPVPRSSETDSLSSVTTAGVTDTITGGVKVTDAVADEVALVAAEDTRTAQKLWARFGLQPKTVSYFEGNEDEATIALLEGA